MKTFPLTVATPDGLVFRGEALSLLCRTSAGDVEILAGHTDYVGAVASGTVKIRTEEGTRYAAASEGLLAVSGGEVRFVPTTFEYADDIDVDRAERAKARAEAAIKDAANEKDLDLAKAKLSRALSRLTVARK